MAKRGAKLRGCAREDRERDRDRDKETEGRCQQEKKKKENLTQNSVLQRKAKMRGLPPTHMTSDLEVIWVRPLFPCEW